METEEECELVVDSSDESAKETVVQRLKEFSFYLTESIEKNLNFCLTILEEKLSTKKSNSDAVTAISAIATPLPYIGRGISSALKEGEIFILNKIDKKNAKSVADLVYFFNDHKETMRLMLIESSVDIFYSFERQFRKLTCEGGPRRAMQKLARDASNRIFRYLLDNQKNKMVTRDDLSRGLIFGDSLKNKFGVKTGRTVETDEEVKWKTSSIYQKVGLFCEDTNECLVSEETNSGKYGHRRLFAWEEIDEIRQKWTPESIQPPTYILKKGELPGLISQIREYIMAKNSDDEAMLDREKKHDEVMDDHRGKHEELLSVFLEQFHQVLDELSRNYEEVRNGSHQNEVILEVIKKEASVDEGRYKEISEKLSEIHTDVVVTKEGQVNLEVRTESIHSEVVEIKTKQQELSSTASEVREAIQQVSEQRNPSLGDLVRDNYEVKKVHKVVKEIEPKVRRRIKKLFR